MRYGRGRWGRVYGTKGRCHPRVWEQLLQSNIDDGFLGFIWQVKLGKAFSKVLLTVNNTFFFATIDKVFY
jgi:hypothetical protein